MTSLLFGNYRKPIQKLRAISRVARRTIFPQCLAAYAPPGRGGRAASVEGLKRLIRVHQLDREKFHLDDAPPRCDKLAPSDVGEVVDVAWHVRRRAGRRQPEAYSETSRDKSGRAAHYFPAMFGGLRAARSRWSRRERRRFEAPHSSASTRS